MAESQGIPTAPQGFVPPPVAPPVGQRMSAPAVPPVSAPRSPSAIPLSQPPAGLARPGAGETMDDLVAQMEARAGQASTPEAAVRAPMPATPPPASTGAIEVTEERANPFHLETALRHLIASKGSDLHLTVGAPPTMRLHGSMTAIPGMEVLDGDTLREALLGIITSQQMAKFEAEQELDFAHTIPGVSRFRVNMYIQKGHHGAVFRAIPWEIKSLDDLGMPDIINTFAHFERGFVLVTGQTGSGKSTTLASIVDEVNRRRSAHIMTVEDPIEFIHAHKRSIINQREVGADTHSFQSALKHVLRQDPDVILVGELRDLETISVALTAAETGHLVFATLHTQSAQETISRIVDVFPPSQQPQVQTQLAATLKAVLCQTLVERMDGNGRVAAAEIMLVDDAIANQIRKGQLHQIQSTLATNKAKGMQTLDKHLAEMALAGIISYQAGFDKSSNRSEYTELTGGEANVLRRLKAANPGGNDHRGSM